MYVCLCARFGVGEVVKEIEKTVGIFYSRAMQNYAEHSGRVGCYLKVDLKVRRAEPIITPCHVSHGQGQCEG